MDHDQFLKKLLIAFFGDLLKIAIPHLEPRLRPSQAVFLMQESFSAIVEQGDKAITDLVAKLPLIGGLPQLILIHVEIEGRFKTIMPERMLYYYMHLRLNYRLKVIPIVINLKGGQPGITRETVIDEVDGEIINTFHYYVLGLEKSVAETFLQRPEPLAWGMSALMTPESGDRAAQKYQCLRKIARGKLGEKRELMLLNLVQSYLELAGTEKHRYDTMVASEQAPEVKVMELTWAGQLEAKGEARGEARGARHILLRFAEQRFGPLPESIRNYLASLDDLDELDRLSDRLFKANSLEELGLPA